ncbi:DUF2490 domain-containing protein [Sphingomonas sp. ID1715]|uniref:DUF2490 domain-containing protein n=1 Tax=Sphingomonas sp. ID1715 TaxID=1656898 RepID=UPI0020C3B800|nr:DUF2490 domain-containing protein [Sphingomonas sp. ID1715]
MQAQAAVEDEQLWLQANTNVPVAQDVRLTLEQIARFSDRQGGLFQSELGALLQYRATKRIELGFGYRYVGSHNRNSAANENRFRVQAVGSFGRVSTRLRVDARFNPRGDEIGFRIRPLVRYNHPLGREGVFLFGTHESFLIPNSTSWGQRSGYERMRNTVGLAFPIGKQVAADLGYLNEYRFGRGGARDQVNHALSLQLTVNLRPVHLRQRPDDSSTH